MKLCSLYIENFGALSRYSLTFDEGITVVQEPNGFGKTTLAEFIRAMFYGFPRKAKTLDKSKRQKYTPWGGGKFGGNLIFEYQGQRYRVERTFGATPKGDSFTLIDLQTNKKSDRFSEEIGLELFQLDADSFERSTYMPQQHDLGSLTTDSIQAKLADLVEDRGDVGNYDKAVAALKAARSGFVPYRGSGGTVAQAQGKMSELQVELSRASVLEQELERTRQDIFRMEEEREALRRERKELHERILRASEAAAVTAAHETYARLMDEENKCRAALAELNNRYPKGFPGEERLTEARQAAEDAAALAAQAVTTREDLEARRCLEDNRDRFEGRIPGREALDACRERITAYHALRTEGGSTGLSEAEKDQYEKLLPMAESGAFTEARLDMLDTANRELTKKRHELEALAAPEEEKRDLQTLKAYFEPGVPGAEELQSCRQALAKAAALGAERAALLTRLAAEPEKRGNPIPLIVLSLLAAAGVGAGVFLLIGQLVLWGAVALGTGALCLMGAVVMGVRRNAEARQEKERLQKLQEKIGALERTREELEQRVGTFARRYTRTEPLSDALHEIRAKREAFAELASKAARREEQRQALEKKCVQLEAAMTRELGTSDFDRGILELRLAKGQLQDLQEEIRAAEEKLESLNDACEEHRGAISEFLGAYFETVEPGQFHSLLSELERGCEAYLRALNQVEAWEERKRRHGEAMARCETLLAAFFEEYALVRDSNIREQLMGLRDDRKEWENLLRHREEIRREKTAYEAENREKLAVTPEEQPEDPAALRLRELQAAEEIETLSGRILNRKQQLRETGEVLSRMPALRDELERWTEKKNTDQKKAALLDDTMNFLEKAREKLQNSYLGPVREAFSGYMEQLLGEKAERILLTPDLDVQLERSGQARELGYFSAGQTDTVMLCMRLALVDALFTAEKPFVILDDPFVNLDDERTEEALNLLRELGKDRQILYLVCNSSRNYE